MQPMTQDTFKLKLVTQKSEMTGLISLATVDLLANVTPHVAVRQSAIRQLIKDNFADGPPDVNPFELTIPVCSNDLTEGRFAKGVWPHMNVEQLLAILQATASDLDNPGWRRLWRNTKARFKFIEQEKWSTENLSLREDLHGLSTATMWTTLQKMQFVISEARRISTGKRCTVGDLAKHLKTVRVAAVSEKFSEEYVSTSLQVGDQILKSSEATRIVASLDEAYSHLGLQAPLGAYCKLMHLLRRSGGDRDCLLWILGSMEMGLKKKACR